MLQQGVELMLLGMGVVFALLVMLVFVVKGMSRVARIVDASGPEPAPEPPPTPLAAVGEGELVAAVAIAIHMHRSATRRQA